MLHEQRQAERSDVVRVNGLLMSCATLKAD